MAERKELHSVRIVNLKLLPNARGRLQEIQRSDDEHYLGFAQAYITSTYPGVIKAWYLHHKQTDQIASVKGLVKLALFDAREDSPTRGAVQEIFMGELAPKLVQIPPGIWHGFQAVGPDEAFLLHLNSEPYRADQPDEIRLPIDSEKIPYTW
jgi:dTDP-4-dehydrorhamnose 3,5-epimerase